VVLGTISSVNDAIEWLKYTYLYVRMKKNPLCYGVSMQMLKVESSALFQLRILTELDNCFRMIQS
jgi:replicative superfamily II helicase